MIELTVEIGPDTFLRLADQKLFLVMYYGQGVISVILITVKDSQRFLKRQLIVKSYSIEVNRA